MPELAAFVRNKRQRGNAEGTTGQEIAFYDALAEDGSAREVMKEVMESDALREMARKLTEMMANIPKFDWTQRESVRADLRRPVRR
jgi:type I restriction enzyme R subunit